MDDEEWSELSTAEKLDWLRGTIERLIAHINGPMLLRHESLRGRVETLAARVGDVAKDTEEPQTKA
jgi:hypothetical protein